MIRLKNEYILGQIASIFILELRRDYPEFRKGVCRLGVDLDSFVLYFDKKSQKKRLFKKIKNDYSHLNIKAKVTEDLEGEKC